MIASLARYIASIPPTPAMLAERAYIADRAPRLADLYLDDRRVVWELLGDFAPMGAAGRPLPADFALLCALMTGTDVALGEEIRRAIVWGAALRADWAASDEAAWVRQEGGL